MKERLKLKAITKLSLLQCLHAFFTSFLPFCLLWSSKPWGNRHWRIHFFKMHINLLLQRARDIGKTHFWHHNDHVMPHPPLKALQWNWNQPPLSPRRYLERCGRTQLTWRVLTTYSSISLELSDSKTSTSLSWLSLTSYFTPPTRSSPIQCCIVTPSDVI